MRRVVGGMLAFLLLAAGCSGDDESEPGVEVPDISETTPEPDPVEPEPDPEPDPVEPEVDAEPEDPFAIPDELTPEYFSAVGTEIERGWSDVYLRARELDQGESLPAELLNDLLTLFSEERFPQVAGRMQDRVNSGFEGVREDFGVAVFDAEELLVVRSDCVGVRGYLDLSATAPPDFEDPVIEIVLAFTPKPVDRDPEGFNPTPWRVSERLDVRDGNANVPQPERLCP